MNIQDLVRERVIGNIKTGKKNEKGIPEKLPYFHVEEDKGTSYDMVEIFKQLYPGQPTKLKIRFTSENPFNFKFKRYVNGKAVCIGNGTKAITVGKDSKNNKPVKKGARYKAKYSMVTFKGLFWNKIENNWKLQLAHILMLIENKPI